MLQIISSNLNGIRSAAKKGFFNWLAKQEADIVCVQELKAQAADMSEELLHPVANLKTGEKFYKFDNEGRYVEAQFGNLSVISEIDIKNWKGNVKNSGFLPEERAWLTHLFDEINYVDVFRTLDTPTPTIAGTATLVNNLPLHSALQLNSINKYFNTLLSGRLITLTDRAKRNTANTPPTPLELANSHLNSLPDYPSHLLIGKIAKDFTDKNSAIKLLTNVPIKIKLTLDSTFYAQRQAEELTQQHIKNTILDGIKSPKKDPQELNPQELSTLKKIHLTFPHFSNSSDKNSDSVAAVLDRQMPNKIISYVEKHPNITYYFSCAYHSFDFEYMHSFIINSDEMKKLNQLITDPKLPLYLEINTDLSSKLDDKISSLIEHSIRPLTVKVAVNDNTCSDMIVPLINAIYINYQHTNGLSLLDLSIEPYDQTFRSQIIGAENDQYKNQALMAIEQIKIAIQGEE
ncbi:hypothetical protein ACTFIZ_007525 [Dictyostelium cf. discoideum]